MNKTIAKLLLPNLDRCVGIMKSKKYRTFNDLQKLLNQCSPILYRDCSILLEKHGIRGYDNTFQIILVPSELFDIEAEVNTGTNEITIFFSFPTKWIGKEQGQQYTVPSRDSIPVEELTSVMVTIASFLCHELIHSDQSKKDREDFIEDYDEVIRKIEQKEYNDEKEEDALYKRYYSSISETEAFGCQAAIQDVIYENNNVEGIYYHYFDESEKEMISFKTYFSNWKEKLKGDIHMNRIEKSIQEVKNAIRENANKTMKSNKKAARRISFSIPSKFKKIGV